MWAVLASLGVARIVLVSSAWGVTGEEGFVYNLRRELTLESAGPCDDDRALYEP